jgi:pimeloyl-ACP methyl ester carboxylesterase
MARSAYLELRLSICALSLLVLLTASSPSASALTRTSGFAEVNGTRLYYETMGKGRAVIFIHGGLVDSRMWDDQFAEFARHYHVIRYDLRGFGKSDFPATPFSYVEDLYALLKFLKIDKASLVGLSLGGQIATEFALEHAEIVDVLVLTSSSLRGYPSPRNEKSVAVYKALAEQGREKAIEMWLEHPFFATGKNNPGYQRRMRIMLAGNFKNWAAETPISVTWPTPPAIERLSAINARVLIVVGDEDAPNILAIAETLRLKIKDAKKATISGVSHHLNMEKPKEYNKLVLDFLK